MRFKFLGCLCLLVGCSESDDSQVLKRDQLASSEPLTAEFTADDQKPSQFEIQFTDVTDECGIQFMWRAGPTPQHRMTEQNGGGIALLDYDGDAVLDMCLINAHSFESDEAVDATSRLYRGNGAFHFDDVSSAAQLHIELIGMGAAAGDFDADGFTDLFVAGFGRCVLFQNQGDGTFREIAKIAGISTELWATSAGFADLDGDGLLDLFVVTYVDWKLESPPCRNPEHPERLQTCSPANFSAQPDLLYRNLGTGEFEEIAGRAGVASTQIGKGLALDIADYNEDGRLDVFVANDTTPNSLFLNQGDFTFEDAAVQMGVAVSYDGTHGASMGVGTADYDRDGHLDLFVTNFRNQVNDLFGGLGAPGFVPKNVETGINPLSLNKLAFGVAFADFDLDGWEDLIIANGHIWDLRPIDARLEYQMTPDLLKNVQGRYFQDVSPSAGEYFQRKWLGRAVAIGDLDNDGDYDLVIQHIGDPAAILRNDSRRASESITLQFVGTQSVRQPRGCRVECQIADKAMIFHCPSGGSFQASHDPRVIVPLLGATQIDVVRIVWPDGTHELWEGVSQAAGAQVSLIQGTGSIGK